MLKFLKQILKKSLPHGARKQSPKRTPLKNHIIFRKGINRKSQKNFHQKNILQKNFAKKFPQKYPPKTTPPKKLPKKIQTKSSRKISQKNKIQKKIFFSSKIFQKNISIRTPRKNSAKEISKKNCHDSIFCRDLLSQVFLQSKK